MLPQLRLNLSYTLLMLFGFLCGPTRANATPETICLVVSGLYEDHNDAFERDRLLDPYSSIMSKKCLIFNSWTDLRRHYDEKISHLSPETHQVFIYQGAHGGKSGIAHCNDGRVDGNTQLRHLTNIASRFKTAFVGRSCYSGDLIRTMLELEEDGPSVGNLCMVTSSSFSETSNQSRTNSGNALSLIHNGQNMEDVYYHFGDGLISSAAWDTYGVTDFFKVEQRQEFDRLLHQAPQLLKRLTERPIFDSQCEGSFEVCRLPGVESPGYDKRARDILYRILGCLDQVNKSCSTYCNLKYSNIIRDFSHGSLRLPEADLLPRDRQRRAACRNFIFDDPQYLYNEEIKKEEFQKRFLWAIKRQDKETLRSVTKTASAWGAQVLMYPASKGQWDVVEILAENLAQQDKEDPHPKYTEVARLALARKQWKTLETLAHHIPSSVDIEIARQALANPEYPNRRELAEKIVKQTPLDRLIDLRDAARGDDELSRLIIKHLASHHHWRELIAYFSHRSTDPQTVAQSIYESRILQTLSEITHDPNSLGTFIQALGNYSPGVSLKVAQLLAPHPQEKALFEKIVQETPLEKFLASKEKVDFANPANRWIAKRLVTEDRMDDLISFVSGGSRDPKAINESGILRTMASFTHNPRSLEYVIQKGADVNRPDPETLELPLGLLLRRSDVSEPLIQVFLRNGINVDLRHGKRQVSLLSIPLDLKNLALFENLRREGFTLKEEEIDRYLGSRSYLKSTPLPILHRLIQLKGCSSELSFSFDCISLVNCAIIEDRLDIVRILVEECRINLNEKKGSPPRSPSEIAEFYDKKEILHYLRSQAH